MQYSLKLTGLFGKASRAYHATNKQINKGNTVITFQSSTPNRKGSVVWAAYLIQTVPNNHIFSPIPLMSVIETKTKTLTNPVIYLNNKRMSKEELLISFTILGYI